MKHVKSFLPTFFQKGGLISSLVLVGCYATIAQVLLVREFLVVFYGSELCLGIIFGSWLLGVALGAAIAGRIFERF